MADALSEFSARLPADPDAQATVTDFIDYTEFFPSDLFRSLTLIGKLDDNFLQHAAKVHQLTKTYGTLPNLPPPDRPDPEEIRKDISTSLHHALRCRESSYAEAARLSTVADNLTHRIRTIKRKLQALPKPPSRDPTPAPKAASPTAQRSRKNESDRAPRIKLKTDVGTEQTPRPKKHRSRRVVVPGEVLPPFDPSSPGISDESESEPELRAVTLPRARDKTPKMHKLPKFPKSENVKFPKSSLIRLPGSSGTNVHSSVAGISVSNAMALLEPPPPNPQAGSKHAPWLSLTEWELNKIRKRMKKNADWLPSEIMVKRELAASGRGMTSYMRAKAHAEETGEEFLDEEPEDFKRPVNYKRRTSEPVFDADGEEQLVSRGMKLNEAKKLKRKLMLQEAAEREEREEANRRITQAGLAVNDLFSQTNGASIDDVIAAEPKKSPSKRHKKRRRASSLENEAPREDAEEEAIQEFIEPLPKKIKLGPPAATLVRPASRRGDEMNNEDTEQSGGDLIVLDTPAGKSPPRASRAAASKQASNAAAAIKMQLEPPGAEADQAQHHRPTSIRLKLNPIQKSSTETPERRGSLRSDKQGDSHDADGRTKSNNGTADTKVETPVSNVATGRRSKRSSLPDTVISGAENDLPEPDSGNRKPAVSTKKGLAGSKKGRVVESTPVVDQPADDPSEDAFCLCGGPSSGRMIACDDPHCKIEWFHLECVGLNPNAGASYSRATWYCPDCRTKHGVKGNGIVKVG